MERRDFVKSGAGVSLFIALQNTWGSAGKTDPETLLVEADLRVIKQLSSYCQRICVSGGHLARAKQPGLPSHVTDLLVCVNDVDTLQEHDQGIRALAKAFGPLRVNRHEVSFAHQSSFYRVEHLLPEDFNARLEAITDGDDSRLTFTALSYEPAKEKLHDAFGVTKDLSSSHSGKINPRANAKATPAGLADTIKGRLACHAHGMEETAAFEDWVQEVFAHEVKTPDEASMVVDQLLQGIAALARWEAPDRVTQLIESPLVASSFALQDGRATSEMAGSLAAVNRRYGNQFTSSEKWLAILIGSADEQWGYAHRSLAAEDGWVAAESRAALPGALEILSAQDLSTAADLTETTFGEWASQAGLPSEGVPLEDLDQADPDGDGVPNLVEYGLGMDPSEASTTGLPKLGSVTIDGQSYLTLSYQRDRSKADISYHAETSTDLHTDWTTEGVIDDWVSEEQNLEQRRARVLHEVASSRYLRLKISRR